MTATAQAAWMKATARWLGAMALAYLLVLQSVLGFAAGAQHGPGSALATEGLCLPSQMLGANPAPAPDSPDHHDALCCLMGCTAGHVPAALGAVPVARLAPPLPVPLRMARPLAGPSFTQAALFPFDATGPPARA
ncbi:hypothetical protein J5J86_06230 [Aquabacter sp. L1I39]|uniref:hypothetical protein n=1 Tax=Aquabacter sp. L1I39 TaxID=2820278 RepID=UPI001ADC9AEF|nr:hypothetical protein [Aquabacter sp. L1I39]QTL04908.1 hypothetical protein J5J86_06230 [Aquabacter sp. L1I39]